MANILSNSVKRIVVESSWLPPIIINDPLAPTPPDQGVSPIVKALKPKITIVTSFSDPVVTAPYGQPTQNWPMLRNLTIGLGIFYIGLKLIPPRRRDAMSSSAVSDFGLPPCRTRRSR